MKLLLRKDIPKLGLIGEVVEVSAGYARNHLLPQRLAVTPTKANMQAIELDKKKAAQERTARATQLEEMAKKLHQTEVTISAAANPEGRLYGSVGPKEIAAALREEGHAVESAHVRMGDPIHTLDTTWVNVEFMPDVTAEVKVWVVREHGFEDEEKPADKEVGNSGDATPAEID